MVPITQCTSTKKFILIILILCQSSLCFQGQKICDIFTSNYRQLYDKNTYIDKSDFIEHFLVEESSQNVLITRPRRSGKSLNLNMLKEYMEIKFDRTTGKIIPKKEANKILNKMFQGKKISNFSEQKYFRGQIPVIFLDFKSGSGENIDEIKDDVRMAMACEFSRYKSLFMKQKYLDNRDKQLIEKYADGEFGKYLKGSLRKLTEFVYKTFRKEVYVLVDEYDAPIINAFFKGACSLRPNSLDCSIQRTSTIELVTEILHATLKTNKVVERGLIMGVAYFSDGEIFSSLNNVNKHTVLHLGSPFVNDFGFTGNEVNTLLNRFGIKDVNEKEMKYWYDGYQYWNESESLYSPVSVIQFVKTKRLSSYWIDTGGSNLLQTIFAAHVKELWSTLMNLIKSENVIKKIPISISIKDLMSLENSDLFYSAAIHLGYLNAELTDIENYDITKNKYVLSVPNYKIRKCMYNILVDWLKKRDKSIEEKITEIGNLLFEALITTDVHEKLKKKLSSFFEIFLNVVKPEVKPEVKPVDQDDYLYFHELCFEDMIMICLYATDLRDYMICNTRFNKIYGNFASIIEFKATREENEVSDLSKTAIEQPEKKKYIDIIYDRKYVHPEIKYVIYLGIVFNAFIENNVAHQNVTISLKNVTVVEKSVTADQINYKFGVNKE